MRNFPKSNALFKKLVYRLLSWLFYCQTGLHCQTALSLLFPHARTHRHSDWSRFLRQFDVWYLKCLATKDCTQCSAFNDVADDIDGRAFKKLKNSSSRNYFLFNSIILVYHIWTETLNLVFLAAYLRCFFLFLFCNLI